MRQVHDDYKEISLKRRIAKYRYYYLLLLPAIIYFVLFHYKPMYGVIIAFKDYRMLDGIIRSPWVGFKNFERLFSSIYFYRVLRNTVIISLLRVAFGFPAPIILALLLNEIRSVAYKKIVQSISYLPHFISWVVIGGMLREILSPTYGAANYVIGLVGIKPIYFLAKPQYFRAILIITGIWKEIGWGSIIFLASISSIDVQEYEAAHIDGAHRFQQAIYITIPGIMPVVTIIFLLNLSGILNAGFDQIFNLYNPRVYEVADIIDTYVYRVGILDTKFSFAVAAGLFKNVVGLALLLAANAITRRLSEYALW